MTTYPTTPERPITRAEIDRLNAIIERLNAALDAAANREDGLCHEVEVQRARAEVCEVMLRGWSDDLYGR